MKRSRRDFFLLSLVLIAILALAADHPIAYAFENNPTVRGYYKEAGATSVSAGSRPAEVEEMLVELRSAR